MKKRTTPAGIIVVIVLAAWLFKSYQPATPEPPAKEAVPRSNVSLPDNKPGQASRQSAFEPREFKPYQVSGVRILDLHTGRSLNIHSIDLRPILERIAAGERHPHRNDGSVFRNSAQKLPKKPTGYYREYVVPTEGIRGPGPQRGVLGKDGEVDYTWDHYVSFIEVKGERYPCSTSVRRRPISPPFAPPRESPASARTYAIPARSSLPWAKA